jgi:hypothetical protein
MAKQPNFVQRPTSPTIYAPMKLPPMVTVPKAQDPHSYNRPGSAPLIPANGPSRPLGPMTNTPNQVR